MTSFDKFLKLLKSKETPEMIFKDMIKKAKAVKKIKTDNLGNYRSNQLNGGVWNIVDLK